MIKTKSETKSETKSLIDRQVYFKMAKKEFKESNINYLTPGKLYTIVEEFFYSPPYKVVKIYDDHKYLIFIIICKNISSAHLGYKAHWILKRASKKNLNK